MSKFFSRIGSQSAIILASVVLGWTLVVLLAFYNPGTVLQVNDFSQGVVNWLRQDFLHLFDPWLEERGHRQGQLDVLMRLIVSDVSLTILLFVVFARILIFFLVAVVQGLFNMATGKKSSNPEDKRAASGPYAATSSTAPAPIGEDTSW